MQFVERKFLSNVYMVYILENQGQWKSIKEKNQTAKNAGHNFLQFNFSFLLYIEFKELYKNESEKKVK